MALTKADIAQLLTERRFLSPQQSYRVIEDLLEIMKSSLESGEDVMISGFGKFCVVEKATRKGRNPATGEEMILPPRRVVTFKCSGKLRNMVNK